MSNETKQTAVEEQMSKSSIEFFYDEVWACFSSNLSWSECELLNKIKEQAKEVEKTAIIKAVNKGWNYHEDGFVSWMGEQYYNETYGGNK